MNYSQGVAMEYEEKKNEIVIYQPDETIRLEVRLENDTVWLTQLKIAELFGVQKSAISKHIKNIFVSGELCMNSTVSKMETVQIEGTRTVVRMQEYFNLDVIIAVGYRVNSARATQFRIWATKILKEYLLQGYSVNARLSHLEGTMYHKLSVFENRIESLEEKVDFFVQTQTPPLQGVFFEGQLWDACSLVEKLIARAKSSILLIDNWVSVETLDMLAKKNSEVVVFIVTSKHGNKLASSDIAKFNAQYPTLTIKESAAFHDRFLILDENEIYLIGASLKDLGKKCFAFTKMDASTIPSIKAQI